jgi:Tfp pilus assembly protein PilN
MQLPFKISTREKRFVIVGGIIIFLIIISQLFSWYNNYMKSMRELSDAKLLMLEKQLNKLAEKDVLKKKIETIKKDIDKQERLLLQGSRPPVIAAQLQKILKEKAASLNIEVRVERALNPIDAGFYLGIPVEIGFVTSTARLKDFLYTLRELPYLLTVSEMKVRVTNVSNPMDVYTTLIITGFTKKEKENAS